MVWFVSTATTDAAPCLRQYAVSRPVPQPRSRTRGARPSAASKSPMQASMARS